MSKCKIPAPERKEITNRTSVDVYSATQYANGTLQQKKTKLKRPKTEMKQNKDKSGDNQHNELFDVV